MVEAGSRGGQTLRSLVALAGGLGLPNLLADLFPGRPWMTFSLQEPDESHTQPDRAWEGVCLCTSWLGTPAGHWQVCVWQNHPFLPGAVLGSGYLRSSRSCPHGEVVLTLRVFFQGRPQLNVGESSAGYVRADGGGWRLGGLEVEGVVGRRNLTVWS